MAEVVRKATILQRDLPEVNTQTQGYSLRYRIISEDRNRFSHWSPIYNIAAGYTLVPSGNLIVEKNTSHVVAIWNPVSILKNNNFIRKATEYDVWVKWHKDDDGDWELLERIEGTNLTIIPPESYTIDGVDQETKPNRLDVEIYLIGNPPARSDASNAFLLAYRKYNTAI
jgi:hypothetical protein